MADFSGSWVAACGHSVQPGSRFCSVCGQPVGGQPNGDTPLYSGGQPNGGAVPPGPYQGPYQDPPPPALPPPPPPQPPQQMQPQPPAEPDSLIPWSVPEGPPVPWPAPEGPPVPAAYQGGPPVYSGEPQVFPSGPPVHPVEPQAYPGKPQAYPGEQRAWPQEPGPQGSGSGNVTLRFGFDSGLPPFDPGPQQQDPGLPPSEPGTPAGPGTLVGPGMLAGPGTPFGPGGRRPRPHLPRPRGPVVPAIGVAALIVVVAAIIVAARGNGGDQAPAPAAGPTAASSPAPAARQADSVQQAATQLAMLLPASGSDRGDVNHAYYAAQACQTLPADQQVFTTAAAGRQKLLSQLASLPGSSALDASMVQALSGAWTASAQADTDYANWAGSLEHGCQRGQALGSPDLRASYAPGATASADKQTFTKLWNPFAAKYGLPSYTPGQL